ncbi:hypothetical protein Ddc_16647 [Ditylenchus destructor]|nr:hypothetical protein Ddc_16647 [Ditylenchus destructor]
MVHDADGKYRCGCKSIGVLHTTYIIGILGIITSILGLVASFWLDLARLDHCIYEFGLIINLLINMSVIYANYAKNPSFYWPFITYNAIIICFNFLVLCIMMFVKVSENWQLDTTYMNETQKNELKHARISTIIIIPLLTLYEIMAVWFQFIVLRAYQCLLPKPPVIWY